MKKETMGKIKRERYEKRLFRIMEEAGYSPVRILSLTPEELVEVPNITVPNIRTILCVQSEILAVRIPGAREQMIKAFVGKATAKK